MRSEKASWDIWHIIFFEGLKQSQYSCTPAVINRTAFTNITVGGKSEAEKIDFSLMSFTLLELRNQALPGFNATRESRKTTLEVSVFLKMYTFLSDH